MPLLDVLLVVLIVFIVDVRDVDERPDLAVDMSVDEFIIDVRDVGGTAPAVGGAGGACLRSAYGSPDFLLLGSVILSYSAAF